MDCRVLQLVIQSAQGLRNVNRVTAMKPYALVSIRDNHNNLYSSEEKTPEDTEGGSNPTWNSPVTFNLDITKAKESNLELVVKLMSLRTDHWFRDKDIGEVRVFITKLLEGFGGGAKADAVVAEKQMSASVMTTDEKPEGTLVFSYKFESVTTVQKSARQVNFPTAPQNVQEDTEQPAGWLDSLISETAKGIVGTVLNNIGLTGVVASDAAAAPPPPAIQTRVAAAVDQPGADDPSKDNNQGIAVTALNTTGLTSVVASDAAAAPPPPAIQTQVTAAVDQGGADDPSEDNNEGIAGTALNTTGLTSGVASDAAAAPPSPAIQTQVAAAVDQPGADDPSEDNNEEDEIEDEEEDFGDE
nr:protein src2 [Quercus suber]